MIIEIARSATDIRSHLRMDRTFYPKGLSAAVKGKDKLLPVQQGEIRVTRKDRRFCEICRNPIEKVKELYKKLGDPRKTDRITGEINGIIFTRRISYRTEVWVFQGKDVEAVKVLLAQGDIQVQPYDIKVTTKDERFRRIPGANDNYKILMRLINQAKVNNGHTAEIDGIIFALKWSGGQEVWTFRENDLERVKILILREKFKLPMVSEDDIELSRQDKIFCSVVKYPEKIAREMSNRLESLCGPSGDRAEIDGIFFTKKLATNFWPIWTFRKDDLAAVLRIIYPVKFEAVLPEDIRVTSRDKRFMSLPGKAEKNAADLNSLLNSKCPPNEVSVELDGIIFTKKASGVQIIWTFKQKDSEKVIKLLLAQKPLPLLSPDDVAITNADEMFRSISINVEKSVIVLTTKLERLSETFGNVVELNGIRFSRKMTDYGRAVWTFSKEDLAAVEKMVCRVKRQPVGPDEVRVTNTDKDFCRIIGKTSNNAYGLNKKLDALLGPEAQEGLVEGVVFSRKMVRSQPVWVFPRAQILQVEKMMVKMGIINLKRYYGWLKDRRPEEADVKTIEFRKSLIAFDSKQERSIGLLLQKYGFIDKFEPGVNLQVRAFRGKGPRFDFLLDDSREGKRIQLIIEHHPGQIGEWKKKVGLGPMAILLSDYSMQVTDERALLAKRINPNNLDSYDVQRLLVMAMSEKFSQFQYLRTNSLKDLFDYLIWPCYYEPRGCFSKSEAYREFRRVANKIEQETRDFDLTILPRLFEIEENK